MASIRRKRIRCSSRLRAGPAGQVAAVGHAGGRRRRREATMTRAMAPTTGTLRRPWPWASAVALVLVLSGCGGGGGGDGAAPALTRFQNDCGTDCAQDVLTTQDVETGTGPGGGCGAGKGPERHAGSDRPGRQCAGGLRHAGCGRHLPHRWRAWCVRGPGAGRGAAQSAGGDQQGLDGGLPVQRRQRVFDPHREPDHPAALQPERAQPVVGPVVGCAVFAVVVFRPDAP